MADINVNALTTISTEPISTDSMVVVNRSTNEGKIIDYELLAGKILDKLTSKQYSTLATTSKVITGAINELNVISGGIAWQTYTYNYTISASTYLLVTATNLGMSTPTGYKPIAVLSFTSGNNNVVVRTANAQATGDTAALALVNLSSSSQTANATIRICYVKDALYGGQLT